MVLPLDKKIKANPRYENVNPVTDTGNNTKRQRERQVSIKFKGVFVLLDQCSLFCTFPGGSLNF